MTGEKDRGNTQEKLWKIDDEYLNTSSHDELVLKLLDKLYLRLVFLDGLLPKIPDNSLWKITSIESEYPIKSGQFIIGYWDIVIICESDYKNAAGYYDEEKRKWISEKIREGFEPRIFLVECKPKISSFGKVLRQLKTYTSYPLYIQKKGTETKVILFTPDLRFKKAFESQGISVMSP